MLGHQKENNWALKYHLSLTCVLSFTIKMGNCARLHSPDSCKQPPVTDFLPSFPEKKSLLFMFVCVNVF